MNLAYLTTVYPSVSHTFIRREILGLEGRGHTIQRCSIRRPDNCVDKLDLDEEEKTFYCLEQSVIRLLIDTLHMFILSPIRWLNTFFMLLRFNKQSDRGLIRHLAYLVEACVLYKEIRKKEIKHIHTHFGTNSTTVALAIKKLGGVSYSFTVHGPDEFDAPIGLSLNEKIIEAEFVVAISNYGAAQLKRWVPFEYWKKIIVVGCTVDDEFLGDESSPLPKQKSERKIVCVARLSAQKGIFILLEALKILKDKNIILNLVLAGDGELRSIIEEQLKDLGLTKQVKITGWIDGKQVKKYLSESNALVLPSFAEGLPVVIMEAFALKKPVITTWIAGIPELVEHGHNGWLISPNSSGALVNALIELINMPSERLCEMGKAGFERVKNTHSVSSEVPKLEKALSNVIGRKYTCAE